MRPFRNYERKAHMVKETTLKDIIRDIDESMTEQDRLNLEALALDLETETESEPLYLDEIDHEKHFE